MINLESLLSPVPSIHSGCEFQCRVTVVWSLGMFTQALSRTIPTVLRWWGSPVSGPHCVRALQVGMAPNAPGLLNAEIDWDRRVDQHQLFAVEADGDAVGAAACSWTPVMLNSTNFCWLNQVEYRSLCCL